MDGLSRCGKRLGKGERGRPDRINSDGIRLTAGSLTQATPPLRPNCRRFHRRGEVEDGGEKDELQAGEGEGAIVDGAGRLGQDDPDDARTDEQDRQAGEHEIWHAEDDPQQSSEGGGLDFQPDDHGGGFGAEAYRERALAGGGVFFAVAEVVD